jgi:competence protein ComEA
LARKILIACMLALLVPTAAEVADAATPGKKQGLLGISPPRRVEVGRPPLTLRPTLVQNTTDQTFAMTVFPALLTQRLDGSFDIDKTPRNLRAAQLILDVGPTKFELAPNRQINIHFRWVNLPRGTRAVYTGLVVTGVPKSKRTSAVSSILRLLGTNFFRLPGPYRSSGTIVRVRGEQAGPRQLRFLSRVRNTGQVADSPKRGVTKIEDADGLVVARLPWTSGVILPRYQREFSVLLKKVLPAGRYTAVSSMTFGRPARRSVKRWRFTLTGPNQLPTRKLTLPAVSLSGNIGDPGHVTATVKNVGTAASPVVLRVVLDRVSLTDQREVPVAALRKKVGSLTVGKSATYSFDLGQLEKASYRATVVAGDGTTDFDQRTANLTPRTRAGFFARIWNSLEDVLPWLLLVLALLAIVFLLLLRRRRDEDEEEDEPAAAVPVVPASVSAPAPRPAAAPVDGAKVNLNTATAEQLMTLPGVGRRAAERVIERREQAGTFNSLDELRDVEGFHGERIARIAEHTEL